MDPILFKIGDIAFPSYTFLIMIGVLVATYLGIQALKNRGLPVIYGIDMAIIGIFFGFLGGRVAHVLVEAPSYYWEKPVRFFYVWQGGFVSWGAYIGVLISWYFYLKWRKQKVWAYFDIASLALPIAMFFGRIGCLLTGCCYGRPTEFFINLTFSDPSSTAYQIYPNTPLHATQAYLMIHDLLIALVLYWFYKTKWRFQGELISIGVMIYAVGRFLIEFLRGDVDRGVYLGFISSGQIVMLFFFAAGYYFYRYFEQLNLPPPVRIQK